MDKYTPKLIEKTGIMGIIGKGVRSTGAYDSMLGKVIYFIAYAGLGALLAKAVAKSEVIYYPDFGAEAVFKMEVKDMPLMVALDFKGKNIYGGLK
jgi:fumarate hydratase subunit beta